MYDSQGLSHTMLECKYHIVWIPKYRKKAIFFELRKYLGEILRELAKQKECDVIEGHLMPDLCMSCFPYHPNIRYLKSLDSLKTRAQASLPATSKRGRKISLVKISGPEVIMFQQSARTKQP